MCECERERESDKKRGGKREREEEEEEEEEEKALISILMSNRISLKSSCIYSLSRFMMSL